MTKTIQNSRSGVYPDLFFCIVGILRKSQKKLVERYHIIDYNDNRGKIERMK